MVERTIEINGREVTVTLDNGEASASVETWPMDLDGETFEYHGNEYTLSVTRGNLKIKDDDTVTHIIKRDGWELDAYVMYTSVPSGLADKLKALGFEYESHIVPMRELDEEIPME